MNWALVFQALIAVVTAGSAVYGTRVAKKGAESDAVQKETALQVQRDADDREADAEDRKQAFTELTLSLAAARADLAYYADQLTAARREKDQLQADLDRRNHEGT